MNPIASFGARITKLLTQGCTWGRADGDACETVALDKLIAEDLGTFNARPDPRVTLKWFYEHRFERLAATRWRPTTQASQPYVIRKWILGQFGDTPLNLLDRFLIQTWLNSLQQLSRQMLKKIRNLFSLMCEEAIDLEYLDRNPVDRVRIPEKAKDSTERDRFLSETEIAALEKLQGREKLVFHMLLYSASARANCSPVDGPTGKANNCRSPTTSGVVKSIG